MTGPTKSTPPVAKVLKDLSSRASPKNVAEMARFGITPKTKILGISVWEIRKVGKGIGKSHTLAFVLWASGIH